MGAWKVIEKYQNRQGDPVVIFYFTRSVHIYIGKNLRRKLKNEPEWCIVNLNNKLMMLQFPEKRPMGMSAHKITKGGLSIAREQVGKFMQKGKKYHARAWISNGNILCDLGSLKPGGIYNKNGGK